MAVFFLLYTGADIAMPQYFCGEEMGGLPVVSHAAPLSRVNTENVTTKSTDFSDGSHQEEPSDQIPHQEDCFCCCAHVLPGLIFANPGASEIKSSNLQLEKDRLPDPPLRSTYHPPRFA
ncbi:MAG: hypothetical protein WCF57_09010 [Pyrinomonadaceae bacterium]